MKRSGVEVTRDPLPTDHRNSECACSWEAAGCDLLKSLGEYRVDWLGSSDIRGKEFLELHTTSVSQTACAGSYAQWHDLEERTRYTQLTYVRTICDSIRIASIVASASIRRRVAVYFLTSNFQELCRHDSSNKIDASLDDIVVTIADPRH